MITITTNENEYNIKEFNELSLNEFNKVNEILCKENYAEYEKYIEMFEMLGLTELMDVIDIDNLTQLIKEYKTIDRYNEFIKSFVIDGYEYRICDDDEEFKLKTKDFTLIESIVKRKKQFDVIDAIAVLYKRTDLTKTEHYDNTHLKYKYNLFKDNVKIGNVLNVISTLAITLNRQLSIINNEIKENESN